jgi:integrase
MPRKPQSAGRGEGSIFRRGTRWYAELGLGVDPATGKRRVWRATGALRREVADALAKARQENGRGALRPTSTETFKEYWEAWIATKELGVRPATYANYVLNGKRLVPLIGQARLSALDEAAIEAAYARLLARGLKGKALSRRSVEQAHTVLTNALKDAVGRLKIPRNPCDFVTVPRPAAGEMTTLEEAEAERLFGATAGTRWHALWILFVTTGMRVSEATGLHWRDVDLVRRRAVINRGLQRQAGKGMVLDETKRTRSRRSVPLSHRCVAALEAHRRVQDAERAATTDWADEGLIFPSARGTKIDPARVREQLARDLTAARCPDVRVHDLRHTCATLLLKRNVHPKIVQELLGHATIAITLDLYSHVMPALSGVVADHMDELFPTPAGDVSERSPAEAHTPVETAIDGGAPDPLPIR